MVDEDEEEGEAAGDIEPKITPRSPLGSHR